MGYALTEEFEDSFEYKEFVFELDMSFDNILLVFEMLDDDEFYEEEKLYLFLKMMIFNYESVIESLDTDELMAIMEYILETFIKGEKEESQGSGNGKEIMDFKQDAGLIYASFLSCYNMDLHEYQGKLHWLKFRELLSNLGEKTPFMTAVGYRSMDIPTGEDSSKEYKDHIRKMKRFYALKSDETKDPEHFNNSLADTFNALKAIAKPKGG